MGYVTARSRDAAEGYGHGECRSCANVRKLTGTKHTAETKAKMRKTRLAYAKVIKDAYAEMWGDKFQFKKFYFNDWGKEVRERDNNTCQKCAKVRTTSATLFAHHIVPKGYFMARALDIDNGVALCMKCHMQLHAELDTYVVNGVKFTATDFINHYHGWKPNGKK